MCWKIMDDITANLFAVDRVCRLIALKSCRGGRKKDTAQFLWRERGRLSLKNMKQQQRSSKTFMGLNVPPELRHEASTKLARCRFLLSSYIRCIRTTLMTENHCHFIAISFSFLHALYICHCDCGKYLEPQHGFMVAGVSIRRGQRIFCQAWKLENGTSHINIQHTYIPTALLKTSSCEEV